MSRDFSDITSKWPHYSFTLDAIVAAATAYFENNSLNDDKRWHPEDASTAIIVAAEAVGAALSYLLQEQTVKLS